MGTRLKDLTKDKPKPLQEVAGRSIIDYELTWARKSLKANKVIVVGGYLFNQLESAVVEQDPEAIVLNNKHYASTQRMTSLLQAEQYIEGDLVCFDGDYIYCSPIGNLILSNQYTNLTVHSSTIKSPYTEQDVICEINDKRQVIDIYKTDGTIALTEPHQEWFNSLMYCPKKHLEAFFDIARETISNSSTGAVHVEDVVLNYSKIYPVDLINLGEPLWMEIDNQKELNNATTFVDKYAQLID